jgi:putative solute:sodium symporter small subunit
MDATIVSLPPTNQCAPTRAWSELQDVVIPRGESMQPAQKTNEEIHWVRTTSLMLTHLGVWFFFGYIIHMFVNVLNQYTVPILKFPLGFYMAAQGSLIVFVVMLFVFAWQQDRIDSQHGVAEDE